MHWKENMDTIDSDEIFDLAYRAARAANIPRDLIDDVAQETALRACRFADSYHGTASRATWVRTIARNVAADTLGRNARQQGLNPRLRARNVDIDAMAAATVDELGPGEPSPDVAAEREPTVISTEGSIDHAIDDMALAGLLNPREDRATLRAVASRAAALLAAAVAAPEAPIAGESGGRDLADLGREAARDHLGAGDVTATANRERLRLRPLLTLVGVALAHTMVQSGTAEEGTLRQALTAHANAVENRVADDTVALLRQRAKGNPATAAAVRLCAARSYLAALRPEAAVLSDIADPFDASATPTRIATTALERLVEASFAASI